MPSVQQKLKILVLLNRVPFPLNDGGAIGAYNFLKGYAEGGGALTILAMNTTKHFVAPEQAQSFLGALGSVHLVEIDNRIRPLSAFLNLLRSDSYITERFISEKFADELSRLLQHNDFDIVHIDGLPPALYIDGVRRQSRAKISMRAHNVEHVIWQRIATKEKKWWKRHYVAEQARRLKKFEVASFEKCDLVMAISHEDQATILQCAPHTQTCVVPAGMDIDDKIRNRNFDPMDLCFIGSFDWMPNLQGISWFLENIWHELLRTFPKVQLHLAGKKMPASLGGKAAVHITAHGEVPDAKAFLLQHGIVVVPIISGSGIRIKIVEAMALGKTVLATPIAAEGLGLKDGETVLLANSAEEFKKKLAQCVADGNFCRTIGENAHRFAYEHYRNSAIFEQLLNRYRTML